MDINYNIANETVIRFNGNDIVETTTMDNYRLYHSNDDINLVDNITQLYGPKRDPLYIL